MTQNDKYVNQYYTQCNYLSSAIRYFTTRINKVPQPPWSFKISIRGCLVTLFSVLIKYLITRRSSV